MGLHHANPVAVANRVPQQQTKVMDLGDSMGLVGFSMEPVRTPAGDFAIGMFVIGGRMSDLVPMQPVKVMVGFVPTMPLAHIKLLLDGKPLPPQELLEVDCAPEDLGKLVTS